MSRRSLAVLSAGLRQPSSTRLLADRLAEATARDLTGRDVEAEIRVVELREHAHDLTNHLLTGFPSPALSNVIDDVVTADGLIAVTPIFSASYSGLFKSFFDVVDTGALQGMPVLLGATGGTERHSLALEHAMRPLFAYLRAVTLPTAVYAATSDWGSENGDSAGATSALTRRVERAAAELAELLADRPSREPVDPFAAPTSFEDLLADGERR